MSYTVLMSTLRFEWDEATIPIIQKMKIALFFLA